MSKIDLTAGTAVSLFLGGLVAILLTLVWGGFWSGLTLSTLWGWFVVPVFKLPGLTIVQAYGLALVVQVAKPLRRMSRKRRCGQQIVRGAQS